MEKWCQSELKRSIFMCTLTVVCLNTGSLKEIEAHQDL